MTVQHDTRFAVQRDRVPESRRADADGPPELPILLVDDHALMRRGLAMTIATRLPGAVVTEAGSLGEALEKARGMKGLAAVVYDLGLTDADGIPGLRHLLDRVGPVPVVVISASPAPDIAAECIRAGASGFLPKWCKAEVLEHVLPLVLNGGTYAPRAGALSEPRRAQPPPPWPAPAASGGHSMLGGLTERQREVLHLLIAGASNKEIARSLGVLEGTVKVHVRAIMQQLNARNRTQVTMLAARAGLLGPNNPTADGDMPTGSA